MFLSAGSQSSDVKSPEESSDETSRPSLYSLKWSSPFTRSFTTYHNNKQVGTPQSCKSSQVEVSAAATSLSNIILRKQRDDRKKREAKRQKIEKEWQQIKDDIDKEDFEKGKYDTFNTNTNSNVVQLRQRFDSNSMTSDYSTTSSSNNESKCVLKSKNKSDVVLHTAEPGSGTTSDYNSLSSTGSDKGRMELQKSVSEMGSRDSEKKAGYSLSHTRRGSLDSNTSASMDCIFHDEKAEERGFHLQQHSLARSLSYSTVDRWEGNGREPNAHLVSLDSLCNSREQHSTRSSSSSLSEDGRELLKLASFDQQLKILLDPKYSLEDMTLKKMLALSKQCKQQSDVSSSKFEKTVKNIDRREAQKKTSLSPKLIRKTPETGNVKRRHTVGGTTWGAVESAYNSQNAKLSGSQVDSGCKQDKVYISSCHIVPSRGKMVAPIRQQRSCKPTPQQAAVVHLSPQLAMESSV